MKIQPEILNILKNSKLENNVLTLPPGQLDKAVYAAVNKVLVNAGGKWNKTAKGHVFPSDPSEKLGLALTTGESVSEKKTFQMFFTPSSLAAKVVELAEVSGQSVLEPSAGNGALVKECWAQGAKDVDCVELNEENAIELRQMGETVWQTDFLALPPARYDRVVMNPPFTKNQDITHVEHGLKNLVEGGILVSIMAGNTERPRFRKLVENLNHEIIDVPDGSFKESGTNVRTVILKVRK
jgi:16S rRNA G966 N2-methylase RsmD